ncbi:E3 ubiquitin-protein ligase XBAT35-like protein [Perkinsela sp. CCAP 1560/4]|nr:E3 ubiquitin-protein ligase XBAT35-like protein [Perkinsela sp. CCAP 1560/4]|eukprot:KNH05752.1 E3 ubiquitin-protein ligase XBAT35-like protein [Perkinsela sp. CCAP 1560/4]
MSLLPRRYQCFLIALSVYLTEIERKIFAPIVTALHPGVHTEAILENFIGFEHLEREGPLTVFCIGALVALTVFVIARLINAQWNSLRGVFSGASPPQEAAVMGESRTSPGESNVFPLQLVFFLTMLDVLWVNYIPFQLEISTAALSHSTPKTADRTLVERLFLTAHVVFQERQGERLKQHFLYKLIPLLSFDTIWPRIRQVLIFLSIHVLFPFTVSALTSLTYASQHTTARNTLQAIRVFAVLRVMMTGLSGVFLSEMHENILRLAEYQSLQEITAALIANRLSIATQMEIFMSNRYQYLVVTAFLGCLCFVIASARLSVLSRISHPRKDLLSDTREDGFDHRPAGAPRLSLLDNARRRICANRRTFVNVCLILLCPYIFSVGLLWTIYCLQLLLPKIISVGFHFMLFACFSSAILVANFEFLALVSSAIAIACYYSLGHGFLSSIAKYVFFSVGFLIISYWAAAVRWILANARARRIAKILCLIALGTPLCALAGGGVYLHVNGSTQDVVGKISTYYSQSYEMADIGEAITQRIPEALRCLIFGEIRTVVALRALSTIVYERLFSLDTTLADALPYACLLAASTVMLRMARRTACANRVWRDSRTILISSCKHCGVFQSVRIVRRAVRALPLFSSMPAYMLSFVSLAALLVMIGLQQDVDATVMSILSNILP